MKKILLATILFLSCTALFAQKANRETIVIKTQIYCDHCQKCETCGERVKKEFPYIKGLTDYTFDDKAMKITITYNTKKTDAQKIKQTVADLGFDADEGKASAKGLAKLDECCLKKQ